ncbi:swr1 complex component [Lecanora helva]
MQNGSVGEDNASATHVNHHQNGVDHLESNEDPLIQENARVNNESHLQNGSLEHPDLQLEHNGIHTPPTKKRKLADGTVGKVSGQRRISPPWKKIAAEGPTSFVEDGKRKSTRTNFVPIDLQPQADKRRTRGTAQYNSPVTKSKYGGAYRASPSAGSTTSQTQNHVKKPSTTVKATASTKAKSPYKISQPSTTISQAYTDGPPAPKRSHKKKIRPPSPTTGQSQPENPHNTRRIHRRKYSSTTNPDIEQPLATNGWHHQEEKSEEDEAEEEFMVSPNRRPQRLSLKLRMPTVNIQHPEHVLRGRRYDSFQEWFDKEGRSGLSLEDTEPNLTEKEAAREAHLRTRIVDATKSDGLLSKDKCQFYKPEAFDPPDRYYTHQDRLVSHAVYFHKLMDQERRKHRRNAKEWAEKAAAAVREKQDKSYREWKQAQPKTEEDIAKEQEDAAREVYQQIQEDIRQKWVMVTEIVEAHRMQRWRDEQDRLGKEALNEVIEKSQGLLSRRRTRGDSFIGSGSDLDEEDIGDGEKTSSGSDEQSEDEDNMSSDESESDEDEVMADDDEALTQEQLRLKYTGNPDMPEHTSHYPEQINSGDLMQLADQESYENFASAPEIQDPHKPPVEHGAGDLPPATQLDEVDDVLMDDSDESTDMEDEVTSEDEQFSDDQSSDDEAASDDDEPAGLGLLYKKEIQAATNNARDQGEGDEGVQDADHDDRTEKASLIPDATQGPTPTATPATISEEPHPDIHQSKPVDQPTIPERKDQSQYHMSPQESSLTKPQVELPPQPADVKALVQDVSLPTTPVSTNPIKTPIPSLLRGQLREYQHFGLDWLAGLYAAGQNGILADEMGLGKTIQTIALLAHLAIEHHAWGPHLIVVPTSVMLNWEIEFKKFLPGFKVLAYYGTQQERKQKREGWTDDSKWNVWITSYTIVTKDQQIFKRKAWHYMILDEAHNIKNFQSLRWQTLLTFNTRARLLLTGTPLQNNLTELWSLLFFLMPSEEGGSDLPGFADLHEFTSWFRKPVEQILEQGKDTMDEEARLAVSKLHKVLRPHLLRRLKADVEQQMPGKYEHVVYCRLSKRQRYLYDGFMSRAQTRETLASGNTFSIMNALMQLRKVCNHPDLFETRQIVTSFAMPKSAVADFEIKELLVRRRLLQDDPIKSVDLNMINLLPGANEKFSALDTIQRQRIGALGTLRRLSSQQWKRVDHDLSYDGTSVDHALACYQNGARLSRHGRLSQAAYQTSLRSQRRPLYSNRRMELVRQMFSPKYLPHPPMPSRKHLAEWFARMSPALSQMVLTIPERSVALETTVSKFACVTPSVVATDMVPLTLCRKGIEVVQDAQGIGFPKDPYHEARMRLSIAFPDKRLLQYDCGKLQRLDALLRTLQAGGHRALIFTQMTRVLDILEQFLNIHGHRYLRLDGATKIEQRQILTDRFNNDDRILAFILSSRSGGIGINLTGADTVIFYDLDWNPAMDKQCQDRSHRIGQTRDVHIYRLVSEHTIEANILRKANQKRLLDDVVIQEGEFTTDYFNNMSVKDMIGDEPFDEVDAEANAAMDRVLGGGGGGARAFEAVEDQEDIAAARVAEKELAQYQDAADFDEKAAGGTSSAGAVTPKTNEPPTPAGEMIPPAARRAQGDVERSTTMEAVQSGLAAASSGPLHDFEAVEEVPSCDDFMIRFMEWELKDIPVEPPVDKTKKTKKGKEHAHRKR